MTFRRAGELTAVRGYLAQVQWELPEVIPAHGENVKHVELHLVLAGMQRVEIGDAIDAENYRLAVDDEMLLPLLERRLGNPRIALGPIGPVPGEQPYATIS